MSALSEELNKVRNLIGQYQGEELGEANTKTALIDPVLRALGWQVGNLNEVKQEYRLTPKDNPVDYALLVPTPKLFVEAKALGHNLGDHKWATQIVNYGNAAGVKWVVLTDGNEYRIYNACVDVPLAEKLLRTVRLSDPNSPAEETLLLLSKERFDDLENQWNIHFADRQVCGVLKHLFTTPDIRLVHLVKKHVKGLTSKKIAESMARMRDYFVRLVNAYQSVPPTKAETPAVVLLGTPSYEGAKKPTRHILRRKFWTALLERAKTKTKLHAGVAPNDGGWVAAGAGKGGLGYVYVITQHGSRMELWIGKAHQQENEAIFDALEKHRKKIEDVFGEPLSWERLEGKGKRIAKYLDGGGYRDDEAKWPEIQDAMIDAMVRLENALHPFIAQLEVGS